MTGHNVIAFNPRHHVAAGQPLCNEGLLEFSDLGRDPRFSPGWWMALPLLSVPMSAAWVSVLWTTVG